MYSDTSFWMRSHARAWNGFMTKEKKKEGTMDGRGRVIHACLKWYDYSRMADFNRVAMDTKSPCNEAKVEWQLTASLLHKSDCLRANASCPAYPSSAAHCNAQASHWDAQFTKNIHVQTISCLTRDNSSVHRNFIARANSQCTRKSEKTSDYMCCDT